MGCYGHIVPMTAIVMSQWYDLYCVMEYVGTGTWDIRQCLDNANARRLQTVDRFFVGFNAICYTFLQNYSIYIEGRNCRLSTVPGLYNKCLGLRPSDTLLSWLLGWRCHVYVGKPFFGKSLDFFLISKLHYCCVNYIFVLHKRNTAWLCDMVRQTFLRKSAVWPLTSFGTSAWPYRVTLQYSYSMAPIIQHELFYYDM